MVVISVDWKVIVVPLKVCTMTSVLVLLSTVAVVTAPGPKTVVVKSKVTVVLEQGLVTSPSRALS